jgi:hypothetical protein
MRLVLSSFATDPLIRQQANVAFANGEALILEGGAPHDEKAISYLLSSLDFQKDIALGPVVGGTLVGGTLGVAVETLVEHITLIYPAAGNLCKLLLFIVGGVAGGVAAQQASAIPTGKAVTGRHLLDQAHAVEIAYDPQVDHLIAQLKQQSTK